MTVLLRGIMYLTLVVILLLSCSKDDPCYYVGTDDDIYIDVDFISLASDGRHLTQIDINYDLIPKDEIVYNWELNGQKGDTPYLTTLYSEGITGFIQIKSIDNECFIYKEINETVDLSDCCTHLDNHDVMDIIVQKEGGCMGSPKYVVLTSDFKGPSNMELVYEWYINDQISYDKEKTIYSEDVVEGYLRVMTPEDSCYMIKPIEVDMQRGYGVISSYLWLEEDSDGIYDASSETEMLLTNQKVELYSYPAMTLVASVITNDEGIYYFDGVEAAEYLLKFVVEDSLQPVDQDQGQDDNLDSDINQDGYTSPFFFDGCVAMYNHSAGFTVK